jgi:ABC-type multidrug transport system fused ATPase/permease subunit
MKQVFKLLRFVKPYRKTSLLSLALLAVVALMDLAIPRLLPRIMNIDLKRLQLEDCAAWNLCHLVFFAMTPP